jgi:uncharacterized protein
MTCTSVRESPWIFFVLVFILSIPFWLIDSITEQFLQEQISINVPISALMAFNPMISVMILTYQEKELKGVKELLKRAVDYKRVKKKN